MTVCEKQAFKFGRITATVAKPAKSAKNETNITRISASDDKKSATKPAKSAKKAVVKPAQAESAKRADKHQTSSTEGRRTRNPFVALARYVKGSWYELQQVRWPDRRATWGMTGALIAFTLFFVVIILVLDYGFSELFKLLMSN